VARTTRAGSSSSGAGTRRPTSRRSGSRTGSRRTAKSRSSWSAAPGFAVAPDTVRSLVGIALLVAGAITLIALALPEAGILNHLVSDVLRPTFGQGAWLLAALLLLAGLLVERAPTVGNGWGVAAIGGLVLFVGGEGMIHLLWGTGGKPAALEQGGGALGHWLSAHLSEFVSPAGAFVVLAGVIVAGVLLLFNLTLRALFRPVSAGGRAVASVASATVAAASTAATRDRSDERPAVAVPVEPEPTSWRQARARGSARADGEEAGTGRGRGGADRPDLPVPLSSPAPMSQTIWDSRAASGEAGRLSAAPVVQPVGSLGARGSAAGLASGSGPATLLAREPMSGGALAGAVAAGDAAVQADQEGIARETLQRRTWNLPPLDLLDVVGGRSTSAALDHQRNVRIIEEKLRSFQIPATVVGTNTGPVVTQYEVKPDARVKLSRIEALSDDLAMALAARTIRIEAPIPGRDVVGVEIPNHSSEVVGFRGLYVDAQMAAATSKLTFALGRDVSGKAYAVDLARMPHLLISGATGSGKSVCVNALITSLLMRATPAEVQLILVDLKRVELAAYDGLPHLLQRVLVEAHEARSALAWAVGEMEERYKRLAARAERNITAYNASAKVDPEDRLPFIVIVIDELADLIMREGRKVEDPVVKIAQKARAVGIHLVLATQRPSVNVVTGLIKANVPSRIAFAMSSNVDSRTVLDAPGAEDLIGRGDMLYQPADLPRPVRLQGVFVSDAEVKAVTDFWRGQAPQPAYDPDVLAGGDEDGEGGGQFGWLTQMAEDELTPRAAELVMATGKASTSMMQTKLKVGFNRASRLMEELERHGIVGPQDPRNPAVPRHVYGPENWVRGAADADDL
jgi:DNA segregation ATPase FtsK/SpoIIIE, S-DNA-T family